MDGIKHLRGRIPDVQDFISIVLLSLFGGTLLGVLMLVAVPYFEQPPLIYTRSPIPVSPQPIAPGEPITLHIERCNNASHQLYLEPAHTMQNVDTGRSYYLPSDPAVARPGCGSAVVTSSIVPTEAPPGRYVLYGSVKVSGEHRDFAVNFQSEVFTVEAP